MLIESLKKNKITADNFFDFFKEYDSLYGFFKILDVLYLGNTYSESKNTQIICIHTTEFQKEVSDFGQTTYYYIFQVKNEVENFYLGVEVKSSSWGTNTVSDVYNLDTEFYTNKKTNILLFYKSLEDSKKELIGVLKSEKN